MLKNGVRNEALDCTVYALTAVDIARLVTGNAAMSCTIEDDDASDAKENDTKEASSNNNDLSLKALLYEELNQSMISNNDSSSKQPAATIKTRKRKL